MGGARPASTASERTVERALTAVELAAVEWFHGSEKHPYTASDHAESAVDCWHCEEIAQVAVQALLDRGLLPDTGQEPTPAKPDPRSRDAGSALLATVLLGLLVTGLVGAFLAGEQRRCEALREQGSALVERYCGTEAGR
jgi:hypothetical protein